MSASLNLPIVIGTIPFWENASDTRTRIAPTAPPLELTVDIPEDLPILPSIPTFPDDDTVSVRTYTSTPPPFPDDGQCRFNNVQFHTLNCFYKKNSVFIFRCWTSIL